MAPEISLVLPSILVSILFSGAAPVFGAQELDLRVTRQRTSTVDLPVNGYFWRTDDSARFEAISLRYGRDLAKLGGTTFLVGASFQGPAHASVRMSTHSSYAWSDPGPYPFTQYGGALGVEARWGAGVELALGSEARYEHLKYIGWVCRQVRPWITARAGWNLPAGRVTYRVGLEAGWALVRTKLSVYWATDPYYGYALQLKPESRVGALAPQAELGLYTGVRF